MPLTLAQRKTALAEGTGTFVTAVRVTQPASKGGAVVAYCTHTRDLTHDGDTFEALPFEVSKMAQSAGAAQVDNQTISHILNDVFTRANIKGGLWAQARLEVMCLVKVAGVWEAVAKHNGRVGDVTTEGSAAQTEFRGLMVLLNQELGDRTSRRCRYKLGDDDCMVNLASFTQSGTVVSITNQQKFTITVNEADGYYKYGRIIWTSGPNDGLEVEVINNDGQIIQIWQKMPSDVAVGHAFDIVAGDDKTLTTCHNKFANAINHGGEASMPNREALYSFPN